MRPEDAVALVMAGGRGERMKASAGSDLSKPLVAVRGVPLLERNLVLLLQAGFRDVRVAVAESAPDVVRFVEARGVELAAESHASVRCLIESQPLGNIGAAAELSSLGKPILVLFADNLFSLDLAGLLRHHAQAQAALTVATHVEPFRMPYGEVCVLDGRVTAYIEKPTLRVRVSSGTYVLGPGALDLMPRGRRMDVAELVQRALDRGLLVASFAHESLWVDVNDTAALRRAEDLVASRPDAFER
jgi:mannose-1-phosphate guanylyltransferase/phosphomannomutase